MANTTRTLVAGVVMAVALVGVGRGEAAEPQDDAAVARPADGPSSARIRSHSPDLATLIRQATDRSATFRGLVDTIEGSKGIVYVEKGTCARRVRACLLLHVTLAGGNRLLHVLIDAGGSADWEVMGSIGHELRHAIEVLSDARNTNDTAIHFFYKTEGQRVKGNFETAAALATGLAVREEVLVAGRAAAK